MTSPIKLSRLELEVMDHFWSREEASVRDVFESIPDARRPAFTTVQTIAQRLEQKGALVRCGKVGNALIFRPAISRRSVYRKLIDDLLALFGGSAHPLVSHLVDTGKISLEELKDLEARAAGAPAATKRGKGEKR
jgi:predicted transcriptional regulator